MTYFEKYMNGEENEVWTEIYANIQIEFDAIVFQDISNVLDETIRRIKYNVFKIYSFFDYNGVIGKTAIEEIDVFKRTVRNFGQIPISLEKLYSDFQFVDFRGLANNCTKNFQLTDPLFIDSVKNIISLISDGSWEESMEEEDVPYIYFSPDYFHKDNISGGSPYGIELTSSIQFDSRIINSKYGEVYFLDYLRLCFNNFGFPNISEENPNFDVCFGELKGVLKKF